jgi:hypothetical protein
MSGWRDQFIRKGSIIKTVIVDGTGNYTKLSDALNAISDATVDKRYSIFVFGKINDTAVLERKSYVDVYGFGADIIVNTALNSNGMNVHDIVFSDWHNLVVRRQGNLAFTVVGAAVYSGTTDRTCRDFNCIYLNESTAALNACYGGNVINGASPYISNCQYVGAQGGGLNCGLLIQDTACPEIINTLAIGGAGNNSYGCEIMYAAEPIIVGGTFRGGPSGNGCNGLVLAHATINNPSPRIRGAVVIGGAGGVACAGTIVRDGYAGILIGITSHGGGLTSDAGVYITHNSVPVFNSCVFKGKFYSGNAYGAYIAMSSAPVFNACDFAGGSEATENAIRIVDSAAPIFNGGRAGPVPITGLTWAYDDANNGRFRPEGDAKYIYAAHPYLLYSMIVEVVTATVGETVDIGTTVGGHEIAEDISIGTVGNIVAAITNVDLAANAYMYATPSAAIADGTIKIHYNIIYNNAADVILIDSVGRVRISGMSILANGASDGISISIAAVAANKMQIDHCLIETLDVANQKSIDADAAYNDAPIYQCVLKGSLNNVTPAAGTSRGTNIEI